MAYTDKTLTCVDCSQPFVFSASEQEVFASRGFTNEPKRCASCRASRRGEQQRYGDGGGGGSSYRSFSGPRQMFEVTCAQCGRPAQVPFEPKGTRPVYCNDCYQRSRTSRY